MHHRMILRGKIIIISDASFGLQEKLFYNFIWNQWCSLGGNSRFVLKIPLECYRDGVADCIQRAFFDKHLSLFIHIEQAVKVIILRMLPGEMQLIPGEVKGRFL